MRKERRQPTRAELGRITSPGLVIRKVRPPKRKSPARKGHRLFGKELAELTEALERWRRRGRALFGPDGNPIHPPEEHRRRSQQIQAQFDRTARKLTARVDRVEATYERVLRETPEGVEAEKAKIRIKAARRLKEAAEKVRADLSIEARRNQEER